MFMCARNITHTLFYFLSLPVCLRAGAMMREGRRGSQRERQRQTKRQAERRETDRQTVREAYIDTQAEKREREKNTSFYVSVCRGPLKYMYNMCVCA